MSKYVFLEMQQINDALVQAGVVILPSPHQLVIRFEPSSFIQSFSTTKKRERDVGTMLGFLAQVDSRTFLVIDDAIIFMGSKLAFTHTVDDWVTFERLCVVTFHDIRIDLQYILKEDELKHVLLFLSDPFLKFPGITLDVSKVTDKEQLILILLACAPYTSRIGIDSDKSIYDILMMCVREDINFPCLLHFNIDCTHMNSMLNIAADEAREITLWLLRRVPNVRDFFWGLQMSSILFKYLYKNNDLHILHTIGNKTLHSTHKQFELLAYYTKFSLRGDIVGFIELLENSKLQKWKPLLNNCLHEFIQKPYDPRNVKEESERSLIGTKYLAKEVSSAAVLDLGMDFLCFLKNK